MRRRDPAKLVLTAAVLFLASQSGCARNPVTGDLQLALVSEAQEVQMGQQAAEEVRQSMGLVQDQALQQYVTGIGQRLAAASERPNLPWSFAVVEDPTPNAFALPGGPIFITRGLMNLMSSEAQLATVLGHEIGHVTARHSVTAMSRAQLAQIGLGVGSILLPDLQQLGSVASAGLQLLFLSHGREAERQADDLGFKYSLGQGYEVKEMALVFGSLQRLAAGNEQGGVPSFLMTHPSPAERISSVEARLGELSPAETQLRVARQTYLDRIDNLIYGENPREGFFQGDLFLHPDLRFQLGFPRQWQRQNLSQMVMGVSPQSDAAIQLELAREASPDAAAQAFLSQQGLQVGQTGRQTFNGLSAVVASFRAQTQQQVIEGLVAFIAHGGNVYKIIGYSPAGVYANYDPIFRQVIQSFAPVTDPRVLNMQPNRIDIIRTTATMSLAQFNQRYPSVIEIGELAILNQVTGPEAVLPSGSIVKRVVGG